MDNNNTNDNGFYQEEELNLRKEAYRYLAFWPYFLISVTVFITAALIYLRYAVNIYKCGLLLFL